MKLSILIPTIESRKNSLMRLLTELQRQINENDVCDDVQILVLSDNKEKTIGEKRNELMSMASGKYIAYFDDDDMPGEGYIKRLMEGIELCVTCCSLRGIMTWDGENPEVFEHSIRYKEYRTTSKDVKYERYPNHLNCIRRDIASMFKFPIKNFGEDTDYATQIFKSGMLTDEHYIDEVIYYYKYTNKK